MEMFFHKGTRDTTTMINHKYVEKNVTCNMHIKNAEELQIKQRQSLKIVILTS